MSVGNLGTPQYIKYTERRDAESHPDGNEDVFNRPAKDFFTSFTVHHDYATGAHASTGCLVFEVGSYTGNGADNRNISLKNASLDIDFIFISRADGQYPVFYSTDMSADNTKELETSAFQSNQIQSVGTGTFQAGSDATVNESSIEYSYLVLGL
jgi:hypothetical protein